MDIGINGNGWQSRIRRRSERQAEKFRRRYQREHRLYHAIREDAQDILHSSNFRRTRQHIQHGTMTVNSHCMAVAKCSLYLSEKAPSDSADGISRPVSRCGAGFGSASRFR